MSDIKTVVFKRGTASFDMSGQFKGYPLGETTEVISPGLAKRLRKFAETRLADSGFPVKGYICEVYTCDADDRPSERAYCVDFGTPQGGKIGVQGILTNNGWPCLDHGLTIESA